ncbi:MAG: T9SS type A sorting domain-containing protein [candidate division WOR-3 bacterium]
MKILPGLLFIFTGLMLDACDFGKITGQAGGEEPLSSFAWVKYPGNPVFVKSPPGHWDSDWVTCFSVRKIGATYWMYYSARRDSSKPLQIGVATSPDGVNWTRYPDSILAPGPPGAWDDKTIYGPDVVYHNGQFKMWYVGQKNGGGCGIGYATSSDGYRWSKYGQTPVIQNGACLSVDIDGDSLIMLFMANNGFCRASSYDGAVWNVHSSQPVFLPGDTTQWDEIIASPSLVIINNEYHLWYTGADTLGNARGKIQLGWATSTDRGCSWTRFAGNPVLTPTQPWEGKCLYSNNTVMSPTLYQMWYASAGFGYAYNNITSIGNMLQNRKKTGRVIIYPDPLKEGRDLFLWLESSALTNIKLYDAIGRILIDVNLLLKPRGQQVKLFNGGRLRPGVYFISINFGAENYIKKFTVIP